MFDASPGATSTCSTLHREYVNKLLHGDRQKLFGQPSYLYLAAA